MKFVFFKTVCLRVCIDDIAVWMNSNQLQLSYPTASTISNQPLSYNMVQPVRDLGIYSRDFDALYANHEHS